MTQNFANAGVFLVQTFIGIYLILVMIRFLMQVSRADYYNPICQAIVKLTDPAIKPLRSVLPTFKGVDFATLIVALAIQIIGISLIMLLVGASVFKPVYVAWAVVGLVSLTLDIYFFALIVMVIASWIAPQGGHPALSLIYQITDPVCAPARKLLPPMGGIDFSIILVFVTITLIDTFLLVRPLAMALNVPGGLIIGLY